jgi:MFS superfamily sulfate permease-like transporter
MELNVAVACLTLALIILAPLLLPRLLSVDNSRKVPTVLVVLVLVTCIGLPIGDNIARTDLGGDCSGSDEQCRE